MEAAKREEIENRLSQLIAQAANQSKAANQSRKEKPQAKLSTFGVSVIRRRKGKPDLHIA